MNCPGARACSRVLGHPTRSVFVAAFVTSFVVRAATYAVLDLGALPPPLDTSSYGRSLSDNGNVAGQSESHAFLWQGGMMTDVGTLGGDASEALGVNVAGEVVGWARRADEVPRAFLWRGGAMIDLGVLPSADPNDASQANAINGRTDVVGYSSARSPGHVNIHAFLWRSGAMSDLGVLPGDTDSQANALNETGERIVGASSGDTNARAVLWQSGAITALPTLGGPLSSAYGLNELGQIVGSSDIAPGTPHACLWQGGTITDLGVAPGGMYSTALAINTDGDVVGYSHIGGGTLHAVVWHNGQLIDLNNRILPSLGWTLIIAQAINHAGQIIGWGFHNLQTRAFLLIPMDLLADTNRDGQVDQNDEDGKDQWTRDRGAIYTVNYDRDRMRSVMGQPRPDAIHFDDSGDPVDEDFTIGNEADQEDISPLLVRKTKLAGGVKLFFKVESVQDTRPFHLFSQIATGQTSIWGGLAETHNDVDISDMIDELADRIFGLEGLLLKGMQIPGSADPFNGYVDLKLEARSGADVLGSDKVRLKVAPWLMLPHTQVSREVWALDAGGDNAAFLAGLGTSGQLHTEVDGVAARTQWFQDHIEIGYTQRPGAQKKQSVFRLPYFRGDGLQPTWPLNQLLQPATQTFQIGVDLGRRSGDYGGNVEVMPPTATYPLGRIVLGDTSSMGLRDFLNNQEVQPPFTVPTSWLSVGHVDEVFLFTPTSGAVVLAAPDAAYALMEAIPVEDRGRAVFFATGAAPVSAYTVMDSTASDRLETGLDLRGQMWRYVRIFSGTGAGQVGRIPPDGLQDGYLIVDTVWNTTSSVLDGADNSTPCIAHYMLDEGAPPQAGWFLNPAMHDGFVLVEGTQRWSTGTPAIVTVEEIIADDFLRQMNTDVAYVFGQIATVQASLEAAAGGSLSFIELPTLYIGKFSGFLVGSVFADGRSAVAFTPGLVNLMPVGGTLYLPAQYGPQVAGTDIFQQAASALLPNGTFIDDWDVYHAREGEVHCGTITKREPYPFDWWNNQP